MLCSDSGVDELRVDKSAIGKGRGGTPRSRVPVDLSGYLDAGERLCGLSEGVQENMNRAGLETGGKPVLLHSSMRIIRGTEFWRRRSLVLVRIRGLARAVSGALQRTSLMNCVRLGTWWGSRLVMSS